MRALPLLFVLGALCGACQPAPICEGRSLTILEPDDESTVPAGDVNVVVEVCEFAMDEIIELRLTMPVTTAYGFITVDDPNQRLYGLEVPTLPGTMQLQALHEDGTASNVVTFDVDPED